MSHPLVAQLRSPNPALRRYACLAAPGDPAAVLLVDALVPALGDPVRAVWRAASDALVSIARRDPGVWPALRGALTSEDARTRRVAALAGARIAPRELRERLGLPHSFYCAVVRQWPLCWRSFAARHGAMRSERVE